MNRIFLAAACLLSACAASSKASYGQLVRYEADNHAWVARKGDKSWWFRSPITGCTLQCRDDVVRWADAAARASRLSNQRAGAILTGTAATLPLALPAVFLFLPAWGVSAAVSPKSGAGYHQDGDAALKRNDREAASQAYLLALAEGDHSAAEPLAQLWEDQGNLKDAQQARGMLICCGAHLGADAWSRIEAWYRAHGGSVDACSNPSRDPVVIDWRD